jgi:predicted AAA+ superfamily ATPase
MIDRRIHDILLERLDESPAVALLGPRQVGKTTLAQKIGESGPSILIWNRMLTGPD